MTLGNQGNNMADQSPHAEQQLRALIEVMARLRDPKDGCAWDLEQTHASIAPYTIEEAYEVAEAVDSGDPDALRDELGDLLLQVIFQARIAEEAGHFAFADIAKAITDKMIRRHPHIFGDASYRTQEEQRMAWEEMKSQERAAKKETRLLDGIATTLPAISRAEKLQKRAARVGFDWPDAMQVMDKLKEEIAETEIELKAEPRDQNRLMDEIGDLLFCVVNLARKTGIDPELALKYTNQKFTNRFNYIDQSLVSKGLKIENASLDTMENLWIESKQKI
jgi:ATP diphosphatase